MNKLFYYGMGLIILAHGSMLCMDQQQKSTSDIRKIAMGRGYVEQHYPIFKSHARCAMKVETYSLHNSAPMREQTHYGKSLLDLIYKSARCHEKTLSFDEEVVVHDLQDFLLRQQGIQQQIKLNMEKDTVSFEDSVRQTLQSASIKEKTFEQGREPISKLFINMKPLEDHVIQKVRNDPEVLLHMQKIIADEKMKKESARRTKNLLIVGGGAVLIVSAFIIVRLLNTRKEIPA